MKLHGYNLLVDVAAAEPADIAQVLMKLRDTIVLLLEEGHANRLEPGKHTIATKRAHQIVRRAAVARLEGKRKGRPVSCLYNVTTNRAASSQSGRGSNRTRRHPTRSWIDGHDDHPRDDKEDGAQDQADDPAGAHHQEDREAEPRHKQGDVREDHHGATLNAATTFGRSASIFACR
jgi:hypothetical protein